MQSATDLGNYVFQLFTEKKVLVGDMLDLKVLNTEEDKPYRYILQNKSPELIIQQQIGYPSSRQIAKFNLAPDGDGWEIIFDFYVAPEMMKIYDEEMSKAYTRLRQVVELYNSSRTLKPPPPQLEE